jgi:aromatic ring-opening dioxygenase catalytic subunit (LigB family)
MPGGLIAVAVAPHAPRLGIEERVPPFQTGLIDGLKQMGQALRDLRPDLFVVNSAHWVSTFNWYATLQNPHQGICVAHEAPDLMPGTPYERKGDPAFARAFVEELKAAGMPALPNESPHFQWDYAALVPLLYLDPDGEVPVVQIPTVLHGALDEAVAVGRLLDRVAQGTGRRVCFLASTALSHALERGPEKWPTPERIELDRQLIGHLERGEVARLLEWLPTYCRAAVAEMGGKVLAVLCGALAALHARAGALRGRLYGAYAQSSGSGNASVAVVPT